MTKLAIKRGVNIDAMRYDELCRRLQTSRHDYYLEESVYIDIFTGALFTTVWLKCDKLTYEEIINELYGEANDND
jgi:hypothetical protein